jgi:crossover junction endodeoxyribonuclease RuvC
MIKVIGIDPGLAETGIGIVNGEDTQIANYSFGNISTSSKDALPYRLNHIFSRLLSLLKEEKPRLMVVEDVFFLKEYPVSGLTLGQVTGVILLASYQAGIAVARISVREVKQIITGNGNADKKQLEASVRRYLGHETPIRPDHASDALALAMTGLFRYDSIS